MPEDADRRETIELVEGVVVMNPSPTPWHSEVAGNLYSELRAWAKATGAGKVLIQPVDVALSEDSVLVPDVLFVRAARTSIIGPQWVAGPPDLVAEVLSPSTRKKDLVAKRRVYELAGVGEYWIIDPDARAAEVLVLRGGKYESLGVISQTGTIRSPLLGDCTIPLERVFE